jgi:hypothetical protein
LQIGDRSIADQIPVAVLEPSDALFVRTEFRYGVRLTNDALMLFADPVVLPQDATKVKVEQEISKRTLDAVEQAAKRTFLPDEWRFEEGGADERAILR